MKYHKTARKKRLQCIRYDGVWLCSFNVATIRYSPKNSDMRGFNSWGWILIRWKKRFSNRGRKYRIWKGFLSEEPNKLQWKKFFRRLAKIFFCILGVSMGLNHSTLLGKVTHFVLLIFRWIFWSLCLSRKSFMGEKLGEFRWIGKIRKSFLNWEEKGHSLNQKEQSLPVEPRNKSPMQI